MWADCWYDGSWCSRVCCVPYIILLIPTWWSLFQAQLMVSFCLGFSRKSLYSSVLLYYFILVRWLFYLSIFKCHQEQDADGGVLNVNASRFLLNLGKSIRATVNRYSYLKALPICILVTVSLCQTNNQMQTWLVILNAGNLHLVTLWVFVEGQTYSNLKNMLHYPP